MGLIEIAIIAAMLLLNSLFAAYELALASVSLGRLRPLNNMVAAVPILLLGISLLERDGILVILSYLAAIPCILYYAGLALLGIKGLEHLTGL